MTVLRFALAIALDALAFIVWDVGTRPPVRLSRDVAAAARKPAALGRGVARFLAGCALLIGAAIVARPAIPSMQAFSVLETLMIVAALIVENLIGPDIRRRLRAF